MDAWLLLQSSEKISFEIKGCGRVSQHISIFISGHSRTSQVGIERLQRSFNNEEVDEGRHRRNYVAP